MKDLALRALRALLVATALFSVGYLVIWGCATPTSGAAMVPLTGATGSGVGVALEGGITAADVPAVGGGSIWWRQRRGPHLELGLAGSTMVTGGSVGNEFAPAAVPLNVSSSARFFVAGMSGAPPDFFRIGTQLGVELVYMTAFGAGPGAELSIPMQWQGDKGGHLYLIPGVAGAILGPIPPASGGGYVDARLTLGGGWAMKNGIGVDLYSNLRLGAASILLSGGIGFTWGVPEERHFEKTERRTRSRPAWPVR